MGRTEGSDENLPWIVRPFAVLSSLIYRYRSVWFRRPIHEERWADGLVAPFHPERRDPDETSQRGFILRRIPDRLQRRPYQGQN